ncbi:tetratricopeptide repeat protein [Enhygromyxa salina]|uniref:Uncharacterized protein n=1 Tax=Enhygromyxa salina TaxID=215803 RepID=A0A2S9Y7Z1_9BACT|nr:tetratricopeptide repeat protein [Enhygromyxa salina]PRQ01215.1 hypothetical protein ENSA7_58200 [Enhygromyxa salina]
MRRLFPLLSFTIAASSIWTPLMIPGTADASPLGFAGPAQGAAEDPALAQVRALYKQGEIKFQTAEYEQALELWIRAFGMLPDGEETRGIRHALVYNMAGAHSRAYQINRDPAHLRKAKILLENYRADHRALYGDEAEAIAERTEVDDRLTELDDMIAASEAAGEKSPIAAEVDTSPEPSGVVPPPAVAPQRMNPQQQWEAEVKADPTLGPSWAQGQKRIVGGAVLTGLGSVFAIISIGAFVVAPSADVFAGAFWTGGAVTGVIGLGLLIPGGLLIAKGGSQRRQVLDTKPRPIAGLAPIVLPGQVVGQYTEQLGGQSPAQLAGQLPEQSGQLGGGGLGYTLRF